MNKDGNVSIVIIKQDVVRVYNVNREAFDALRKTAAEIARYVENKGILAYECEAYEIFRDRLSSLQRY